MTARNPSDAFQAWASVIHNPPAPPELALGSYGFSKVEEDIFGAGAYVLTMDPVLNKEENHIVPSYVQNGIGGFGLAFNGYINTPPDKIFVVRFEAYPANAPKQGPFTIAVSSTK